MVIYWEFQDDLLASSPPTLKADAADAGKLKVRWDQRKTPTYSKPLLDEN